MKTTVATVFALAGATLVAAQEFPSNMPECGLICGRNMFAKAGEFGCDQQDIACLCRDSRFNDGVRDCAFEACPDATLANIVVGWRNTLCSGGGANGGIPTTTGGDSGDDATVTTITTTQEPSPTTTDDGSDNGPGDDATAISTSAWTSVITGDGVTSTVTGETTILGIGGVPIASTTLSATTSPIVSTHVDETTTFESTVGTSTFVPTESGAAGGGDGNNDGNNPDEPSAAQSLAAPMLGFLVAAGVAAVLF